MDIIIVLSAIAYALAISGITVLGISFWLIANYMDEYKQKPTDGDGMM